MMLCKLSINNLKKSFKDYAIYFFTLILGVCIFYIFNSLDSQTAMLKVSSSTREIIVLLIRALSGVSVFVSLVLGFLIIYASRFLIKKRKKEFGVYLTLGMSKRKISLMLFLETLLIGIISLVVGLLLGTFISQITSVFIANMFEANLTNYTFTFSKSAALKTIMYFGVIYLVVIIFNTVIINKCKLIDLLSSNHKTEKVKIKNPRVCVSLCLLSMIILGVAYYMVTGGINKLMNYDASILLLPIFLGGLGTFLFFFSVSGLFLNIFSKFKSLYYKELNAFTFKQISSKINTMVVSISVICILLFMTICILSSAFSIKNYLNDSINKYAPADFEYEFFASDIEDINKLYEENGVSKYFKNYVVIDNYTFEDFTYEKLFDKYYDEIFAKFGTLNVTSTVEMIKLSDYNKLANIYHFAKESLKDNEFLISCNFKEEIYNYLLSKTKEFKILGQTLTSKSDNVIDSFIYMGANPTNGGFLIVPDHVLENAKPTYKVLVGNFITQDSEEQRNLITKINRLHYQDSFSVNTKNDIKDSSNGLSVMVTFIGLYLGIIFLISSSAILALKALSDAIDDKGKYLILRNIGADEKDINKSLFKQTLIFFMVPLSLAIIHTIFGIKFCMIILNSMGINNLIKPIFLTSLFLIFIYGSYFFITYLYSKNLIKTNR